MGYGIYVGRPVGFALECPDIGTDLANFGYDLGYYNGARKGPPIRMIVSHQARNRIPAARNSFVEEARKRECTHLLMMDPDVAVNAYLGKKPWAKPWLPTFWQFAMDNPGCVLAAPYCGRGLFEPQVQVFRGGTSEVERKRVSWNDAARMQGWERVSGVGTGLMLIDMQIFDRLKRPYFMDHYYDESATRLDYTPDLWFCERCADAGVPVYVCWDCWVGHWQNQIVDCPRANRDREALRTARDRQPPEENQAGHGSQGCLRAGSSGVPVRPLPDSEAAAGVVGGVVPDFGQGDSFVCGIGCGRGGLEDVSECREVGKQNP